MPLTFQKPLGDLDGATVVHEAVSCLYSINKKPKLRYPDSFVFFIWLLNLGSREQASAILQLSWEGEGEQELPFPSLKFRQPHLLASCYKLV